MPLPQSLLIPVAGLSGVAFALIGIAYRMGQPRGIVPAHVMVCIAAVGSIIFGVRAAMLPLREVPLMVIALGVSAGLTQYVLVRVIKAALDLGPLSPAWCALTLSFLPTVAFSSIFLDEHMTPMRGLALAAGIACVLAASACQSSPPSPLSEAGEGEKKAPLPTLGKGAGGDEDRPAQHHPSRIAYVGVLLLIPTFNCVSQIAIKVMGKPNAAGVSINDRFSAVFLFLLYFVIGAGLVIELLVTRNYRVPLLRTAGLGLMAAFGSTAGMTGLTACSALPAATLFPVSNVVSILVAAIVSTLAFGERRSPAWFATIGLGVLAVVLANL